MGWRVRSITLALILSSCVPALLRASDCGATRLDCAVHYLSQHDLANARLVLQEELQDSPQNLKALNLLGITLTESGDISGANAKFQKALAIDGHFYPARKNLAVNQFNEGHFQEAGSNLRMVLADSPSDPIVHIYLAEISYQKKEFEDAAHHYQKGASRVNSSPAWILHFAESLAMRGKYSEARSVLAPLPASDVDNRFRGALIVGRAGGYSDAAELFGEVRKRYSDPYQAGYDQLLMLIRAKSYPAAISLFNELVAQGHGRAELYNLASEAYRDSGDVKGAYDALKTATKLDPADEESYVELAALCLDQESYDIGLDVVDVGLHYVPNSYRLVVQRGFLLVMKGRTEDAEKQFQVATTLAPDKSLPYIALGEVWMQLGKAQKAVDMLRPKAQASGGDFLIPYIFAEALIRSGADAGTPAAAEAIAALERSIQRNNNYAHSHAELGKLLIRDGNNDRGISELEIATRLDPNDSGSFYQLGQAYRKKGDKTKAEQALARVAELHAPQNEQDLNKELRRLVRQDTAQPAADVMH